MPAVRAGSLGTETIGMTTGSALGDHLRARRALLQPEDVGIVSLTRRRVPGLRRDEVARLAGISPEYYLRLEQGRDRQPSDQVLAALGRALRLDGPATEYLFRLVRLRSERQPARSQETEQAVALGVRALVDQLSATPAYVMDANQDVVLVNDLATAMSGGGLVPGLNLPFAVFSDAARAAFDDWQETAERTVATLRYNSDPDDPRLREVVGVLSIRDAEFRRLWARHEARPHHVGPVRQYVDGHGFVTLTCQTLLVPGARGQVLVAFHADEGSPGAVALADLRRRVGVSGAAAGPAPTDRVVAGA